MTFTNIALTNFTNKDLEKRLSDDAKALEYFKFEITSVEERIAESNLSNTLAMARMQYPQLARQVLEPCARLIIGNLFAQTEKLDSGQILVRGPQLRSLGLSGGADFVSGVHYPVKRTPKGEAAGEQLVMREFRYDSSQSAELWQSLHRRATVHPNSKMLSACEISMQMVNWPLTNQPVVNFEFKMQLNAPGQ